MKKTRGLFFFGIFAIATGIGFLSASFNNKTATKVEAKDNYLTFNDGVATLGTFPQTITNVDVETLKANAEKDSQDRYIYQNKQYAIIPVNPDTDYPNDQKFNDGSNVQDVKGVEKAFLIEEVKWEVLATGDGYADLISTRIIYRQFFGSILDYIGSTIYSFNNDTFFNLAFNEKDKTYLKSYDKDNPYYVNLPTEADLKDYEDKYLEYPSDFAIASYLSASHESGKQTYVNAPYWSKTVTIEGDRIKVFWCKSYVTNCLPGDTKIGIRPVIRVAYKSSGGGSSSSSKKSSSGGNAPLVIGITFTILGAGGLVAFFIFWAKKHPSGKPPIWIIISLAGCLVISVVGLGCLAGGMTGGGGGSCLKAGYYVQKDLYSGNGITQVAYSAWLIRSDKTASYCSRIKDNATASDFAPDNYMTGTYKIQGSKLIIDVPEHYIQNFGTVGGTFTFTIQGCDKLKSFSDTYVWVRGE